MSSFTRGENIKSSVHNEHRGEMFALLNEEKYTFFQHHGRKIRKNCRAPSPSAFEAPEPECQPEMPATSQTVSLILVTMVTVW